MESLYTLATELEPGDEIRWVSKKADIIEFRNVVLLIMPRQSFAVVSDATAVPVTSSVSFVDVLNGP